jgi:hypothetical protein
MVGTERILLEKSLGYKRPIDSILKFLIKKKIAKPKMVVILFLKNEYGNFHLQLIEDF